jgi:putative ABC transport system permease protein
MRNFFRDVRYAVRVSIKSPVAAAVAVLALALGIGVNASSFILIESMVLHPLPYPRLERIVTLWETPKLHTQRDALSPADFIDLNAESQAFEKLAAYRDWDVSLTGNGSPERVRAFSVSPEFFTVLGRGAALGRTFSSSEDQGQSKVIVVSQGFWKSHLAASAHAIGQSIFLSGQKYTVIGVMQDDFDFPLSTDIWSPLILNAADRQERSVRNLMVLGLLKPNVSSAAARIEAEAIASRLAARYPATNDNRTLEVVPLRELTDAVTIHFLWTLLGAACFVLLLACANIGNLQMARAATRQKEITVRAALGASRLQIARQLFAESILISGLAGALGLVLAGWNNDYGKANIPAVALRIVPGLRTMHVDSTVVAFTIAVSLVTGIICSLPAIFQLLYGRMGADLSDALRERSGNSSLSPRNRIRTVLIVSELALALVLLVGAGLMVKTFQRQLERDQGFNPKNLLTMQVSLPATEYREPAQIRSFYDRALQGLTTVHEIKAVGISSDDGTAERLLIEGQPEPRPGEPRPSVSAVNGHYFQAMRIPVLRGRSISDADRPQSPGAVVISEAIARHYWPKSSPLGHHMKLNGKSDWLTIVGVCGDIKDWFSGQPIPAAYVSYAQFPASAARFVLRTTHDPMQVAASARARINRVDRDLPVYEVKTMEQTIAEETSGVRAAARMMTTYAVIALLLAITGVYAMFSYFVAARTHDIGIRMALGAGRAEVFRMIMRQTIRLILAGLAFGLPLAFLLARVMSSALYNVVDVDARIFAVFTAVLGLSALLASYLPSRRAMHIDPITALREE